jgi:hypothetical protein
MLESDGMSMWNCTFHHDRAPAIFLNWVYPEEKYIQEIVSNNTFMSTDNSYSVASRLKSLVIKSLNIPILPRGKYLTILCQINHSLFSLLELVDLDLIGLDVSERPVIEYTSLMRSVEDNAPQFSVASDKCSIIAFSPPTAGISVEGDISFPPVSLSYPSSLSLAHNTLTFQFSLVSNNRFPAICNLTINYMTGFLKRKKLVSVLLVPCGLSTVLEGVRCTQCNEGEYSLKQGDTCQPCPLGKKCVGFNETTASLIIENEFWVDSTKNENTNLSELELLSCPNCRGYNCFVDQGPPAVTLCSEPHCKLGHHERLCSVCESGYFKQGNEVCLECGSVPKWHMIVVIIVAIIIVISFIVLKDVLLVVIELGAAIMLIALGVGSSALNGIALLLVLLTLLESWVSFFADKKMSSHDYESLNSDPVLMNFDAMVGIKILLFYVQTLISSTTVSLIPHSIRHVLELLSALQIRLNGLECDLRLKGFATNPVLSYSLIFIIPLLLILLLGLLFMFRGLFLYLKATYFNQSLSLSHLWREGSVSLLRSILFVSYILYFKVVTTTMEQFLCEGEYMQLFPSIPCQRFDVIVISLILGGGFIVGLPIFYFFIIYRRAQKNELDLDSTKSMIGFLYETYKRKYYWAEFVWMIRRILFAVMVVLPSQNDVSLYVMSVGIANIGLTLFFMPFVTDFENYVDVAGLMVLMATITSNMGIEQSYGISWFLLCWVSFVFDLQNSCYIVVEEVEKKEKERKRCCFS